MKRQHFLFFSIAISLLLSGIFFWFHFFPQEITLGTTLLPLWSIVGGVAIVTTGVLFLVSRWSQQSLRFLFAIVFTPALTWYVFTGIRQYEPWQGELLWMTVLWCWGVIELLVTIWPQVITTARWKYLGWTTAVASVAYAILVRCHQISAQEPWMIGLVLLWALALRTLPLNTPLPTQLHQRIGIGLTVLFVVWGGWIRIAAVDTFVFQNDEYFHVNTAVGYLKTGEYKQWHFVEEVTTTDYTRSWAYTWQVAQSVKLFGESEWSMRLPALIWGLLLLVVLPLVTYAWTRSWMAAAFATALASFDPSLIWSSTYTRMYSWFFVMVLVGAWMVWESLRLEVNRVMWKRALWLMGGLAFTAIAMWIHLSGLLLFGGIGIAILLLWMQHPKERWYQLLSGLGVAGVVVAGVVELLHPYLPLYFFVVRKAPSEQYLDYPVQFFILPAVALLGIIGALILRYRKQVIPVWITLAYGMAIPLLIYFAYFANRYGARKYSLFFFPLFFIVMAWAWTRFSSAISRSAAIQYSVGVVSFVIVLLPISIPGVEESWLLEKARSDKTYAELEQYDYEKAYDLMFEHAQAGDAVVILSPRHYYLTRHDLHYILMEAHRKMDAAEFKQIMSQAQRGFVVWPLNSAHMNPGLEKYVRNNLKQVYTADSRVVIYSWGIE